MPARLREIAGGRARAILGRVRVAAVAIDAAELHRLLGVHVGHVFVALNAAPTLGIGLGLVCLRSLRARQMRLTRSDRATGFVDAVGFRQRSCTTDRRPLLSHDRFRSVDECQLLAENVPTP